MIKNYFFVFGIFLLSNFIKSQVNDKNYDKNILKPSKAAFFSAVLPGLGQAYNNKIWKLPIVYTALGVSAYSFDFNKKKNIGHIEMLIREGKLVFLMMNFKE